jgi:hypothetical protein
MARRRRRNQGYPTGGLDISTAEGGSGGLGNAGFDPLDVLSEADRSGGGKGTPGINIEISNIAQAAAEQGGGGIGQTATGGVGGHHQGGQHHQAGAGGQHHHHR